VSSMRRRLLEHHNDLPPAVESTAPGDETVSVLIWSRDPARAARAVENARTQTHAPHEILVVGVPVEGVPCLQAPDAECSARQVALEAATGTWVAWLDDDAGWYPDHIARLLARLRAAPDAVGAYADLRRVRGLTTPVERTLLLNHHAYSRSAHLARDLTPASSLLHRRAGAPAFEDWGRHTLWDFALRLSAEAPLVSEERPGGQVVVRDDPAPDDHTARRLLQRFHRRHERTALFDEAARAGRLAALRRFGVLPAERGLSSVVVLADADPQVTAAVVERVSNQTAVPHEIIVVFDGTGPAHAAWGEAAKAGRKHLRFVNNARALGAPKALNQGIAKAGGDYVALIQGDARVSEGWLGRLQWWTGQAPENGCLLAAVTALPDDLDAWRATRWGTSEPVARIHGQCMVLTRAALDRVGGLDTTLDAGGLEWDDLLVRLRLAGFEAVRALDVPVRSAARPVEPTGDGVLRFARKWGFEPDGEGPRRMDGPFDRDRHHVPFGAEHGFRPDVAQLEVVEAAARNILVIPPWEDAAALQALSAGWRALGPTPGVSWWLRCAPSEGPAQLARLAALLGDPEAVPDLLVVDAPLAPEREAGLYVSVDAVFVDEGWPEAELTARRTADCGRVLIRGFEALDQWLAG
jgi:glycosyltransferase involved in cell wall biosynthesis